MAHIIYVLGESGTGKSYSLKNLPVEETIIFQTINKLLPFKSNFKKMTKEGGNIIQVKTPSEVINSIEYIKKNFPQKKYIVIDDFQYLMAYEFFERAKEVGYQKFTDIGQKIYFLIDEFRKYDDSYFFFILSHIEKIQSENGVFTKIKTVGRLLDEKLTLEGLSTIVLYTTVEFDKINKSVKYMFQTQSDGTNTAKSPYEMFDMYIDNDLLYVINTINNYYKEV